MTIGCFGLNTPFSPLDAQLTQITAWGFRTRMSPRTATKHNWASNIAFF